MNPELRARFKTFAALCAHSSKAAKAKLKNKQYRRNAGRQLGVGMTVNLIERFGFVEDWPPKTSGTGFTLSSRLA